MPSESMRCHDCLIECLQEGPIGAKASEAVTIADGFAVCERHVSERFDRRPYTVNVTGPTVISQRLGHWSEEE